MTYYSPGEKLKETEFDVWNNDSASYGAFDTGKTLARKAKGWTIVDLARKVSAARHDVTRRQANESMQKRFLAG
jgi:hypothetical protein